MTTQTPEPTPSPEFLNRAEREKIEQNQFTTNADALTFLTEKIDEAEARLKAKFPDEESQQKVHIKFETLRREIKAECDKASIDTNEVVKLYTNQLLEYIGGQEIETETRHEGAQEVKSLGAIPKEWEDVFKKIDDEDLDWKDHFWSGNNVSQAETNLKINLISLSKIYKDLIEMPEYKSKILQRVNEWIQKMKETGGSGGLWDNQVTEMDADNLYKSIGWVLAYFRNKEDGKKHEATLAEAQEYETMLEKDNEEVWILKFDQDRQRLFNAFVKPYQEEGSCLKLDFSGEDIVEMVEILTSKIDASTEQNIGIGGIIENLRIAQEAMIALLKEQLPKKFQEQKGARQSLIDQFGAVQIGDKTINDRLTAIATQIETLSGDVNEEQLTDTLATLNQSIVEVFTQLDAIAAMPGAPVTPEGAPASPGGVGGARVEAPPDAAGRAEAPAEEVAAGETITPAGGQAGRAEAPPAQEAEGEAQDGAGAIAGGGVAPGAAAPEAVAEPDVPVVAPQPAEGAAATAPAAAASRSEGAAERAPAAESRAGSTSRIDSFMANWGDKTPSDILTKNNITSDIEMIVNTQRTSLLVRDPEKDFEPKDRIAKGQQVTVLASGDAWHVNSNNFVKVRYGDNQEGWVAFEYLKKVDTAPTSESAAPAEQSTAAEQPAAPAALAEATPPAAEPATPPAAAEATPPPAAPAPPPAEKEVYINLPIHRADSLHYLGQSTIQNFLNRSYKKKGEQSYQDDRDCRKELDRLYEQVIEPLKSTYKPSNPKEKADVALMRLNQTLSMGAFREERGEHPLEKVGEGVRDRTIAPVKEIAQAAFENIIGHATAETLSHAVHLRPGEAARSFGSGLLGAGKNIVSVPAQLLFNKDPFEEGYPELRQARKETKKLLQNHLKSKFPGMKGSEWERVYEKTKISELKNAGKESIYNELERMYVNLGKNYKNIAEFNFNDAKVQDSKVEQLINVMATWGVSNVLRANE